MLFIFQALECTFQGLEYRITHGYKKYEDVIQLLWCLFPWINEIFFGNVFQYFMQIFVCFPFSHRKVLK